MSAHFSDLSAKGSPAVAVPAPAAPAVAAPKLPVPAYSDIAKPANDLITRDFYHLLAASLEVKLKAPNGVSFTTKGTSPHEGSISSSVEGKKALGNVATPAPTPVRKGRRKVAQLRSNPILSFCLIPGVWPDRPPGAILARTYSASGISVTTSWATPADALNAKIELDNTIAAGLKAEVSSQFKPAKGPGAQKLSLFFKQPIFHTRAFFDLAPNGGVQAVVDGVVSHEGFVVGGEVGYDVQKAALSRYSATVGYSTPSISAALAATNNLSVFTASYYQKVNAAVEVGTKAAYDAKNSTTVGLEVASKYKIDPLSFAKAKINDRGIASIAYNTKVNPGFTLGVGASFDTQKLNEAGHKIGASFTFEG